MLERTKRISFRISFVLSMVEPDLHTGSGSPRPAPQQWMFADKANAAYQSRKDTLALPPVVPVAIAVPLMILHCHHSK